MQGRRTGVVGRGLSRMTGGEWIEGTEKKKPEIKRALDAFL
jgi:hypothetical protein